ncbi:MAG: PEP-CTERM sorting domain-containing protein [Isosphaerales bacterium]
MKLGPAACLLSLAFIAGLNSEALADPIQYVAEVYGAPWVSVGTGISVDLSKGGTYSLDSTSLNSPYSTLFGTNNSSSLNSTGYVYVGTYVPSGPSGTGSVWVQIGVTVPISGSVNGNLTSSDLHGGYSGTGASAGFFPYSPSPSLDIPQPLLDLIAHPDRIHVQALVTGGHDNDLVSTLTIDPLSIPEPTALSVLLVGIGGVAWARRKHTSPGRVTS